MMDQISSPPGVRPLVVPAASLFGEWRDYGRFLRRPTVPERASGPSAASLLATGRLLLLDYLLMAGLMVLGGIAYLSGFEFPQNALEGLEWDAGTLLLIVVVAPIMEEIIFRGWLSGRLGHVLALIALVAALVFGGATLTDYAVTRSSNNPGLLVASVALLLLAATSLYLFRHVGAARWYQHAFPLFFWFSAAGFATIHIWNYTEGQSWVTFLLVIPQFVAGTIFGYARVRYGLWSAVLLHALHNGTAVGLAVLTGGMMG